MNSLIITVLKNLLSSLSCVYSQCVSGVTQLSQSHGEALEAVECT